MELFLVPRLLEWKAKHAPGSKTNLLPEANEEGQCYSILGDRN